ncbi:MAG: EamA family transporter [Planctomycetota bacterium]|nr:EamA family transporter [Planctomycetota bacterium]
MSLPPEKRARVVVALLCVWVLWGSTYYAIRVAVEVLPPFLMAGSRFLLAGAVLMTFALLRGEERPRREHFLPALISGAFLMLASNGLVCWAETRVESSIASLVVSCVPLWMLLFDWWRPGGVRPHPSGFAGVAVGIFGVALLSAPDPSHPLDALGIAALLGATISWSIGSLYSRQARLPRSQMVSTAAQMLCGGALQLLAGWALGEGSRLDVSAIEARHVASWLWLVGAGSLLGFSAYLWLLKHTSPALATSYAFVNPLVALTLGAWLGGEKLPARAWIAAALIVGAVMIVVAGRRNPRLPKS